MSIDTLLKINGKNFTGMIIKPFKIGRHKLWGDDTGRLMNGEWSGTLVGIFPKVTAIFMPKTPEELSSLIIELDKASQAIQYYSPKTRTLISLGTYSNDYEVSMYTLDEDYDQITASFIAKKKE